MKKAAALPAASDARLRQPGPGKPRDRSAARKSGPVRCGPGSREALIWCVHCYEVLGYVRSRRQRANLERVHLCSGKQSAKLPASPPPYN